MSLSASSITVGADNYFKTVRLQSTDRLDASFGLRHEVFRENLGFFTEGPQHPGLEYDEYDAGAVHFGTYDREGRLTATARLLRTEPLELPILKHCTIYDRYRHVFSDPARVFEISRLCRVGARGSAPLMEGSRGSRQDLLIGIAMYKALFLHAKNHGADYLVAVMERPLARLLRIIPVNWVQIGPSSDYYGAIEPYACSVLAVSGDIQLNNPMFHQELERADRVPADA